MTPEPQTAPDGTRYTRSGPRGAPAVVLIHGLGLSHEVWQWQMPALAERCDVIAYDLYGHGDSPDPPEEPTLRLFARQLAGVMDACGVQGAAIIGFSLGGMIARRFAQDHPARVAALGILHSPHRRTPEAQEAILKRVEQARREGPAATVEAALQRWFTDDFRTAHPEVMDQVRAWVLGNDIAVYHRNYRVLATGIDEIVSPATPITVPALVITGDEDFGNGPEMARAIAAGIAGAELHVLTGLRHMALVQDPPRTTALLLDFLARTVTETVQ